MLKLKNQIRLKIVSSTYNMGLLLEKVGIPKYSNVNINARNGKMIAYNFIRLKIVVSK